MGGFSEDCRWWWDGQRWIPTSQVVLPQLPPTEIQLSGKLAQARADVAKGRLAMWAWNVWLGLWWLKAVYRPGFREYRTWTIEQLSLAVAYVLGPDEPLVASEVSRSWHDLSRNLAVAVTAAHVLVFRIDHLEGQPRWIAMAARAADVRMRRIKLLFGAGGQLLEVTGPYGRWSILGFPADDDFEPEPVLEAWRKAVAGSVRTG